MVASATYSYVPAFKQFGQQVKIVHFIGPVKPWLASFDSAGKPVLSRVAKHTQDHLRLWWQLFNNQVSFLIYVSHQDLIVIPVP